MPSFLRAFRYRPSKNALTTATFHIKLRGEAQTTVAPTIARWAGNLWHADDAPPSVDDLSKAGAQLDPADKGGEYTKAGRALQKHQAGVRTGAAKFPGVKGPPSAWNEAGQRQLDEILTHPKSTTGRLGRGGWKVTHPDGRGARFNKDGSFDTFVE